MNNVRRVGIFVVGVVLYSDFRLVKIVRVFEELEEFLEV